MNYIPMNFATTNTLNIYLEYIFHNTQSKYYDLDLVPKEWI